MNVPSPGSIASSIRFANAITELSRQIDFDLDSGIPLFIDIRRYASLAVGDDWSIPVQTAIDDIFNNGSSGSIYMPGLGKPYILNGILLKSGVSIFGDNSLHWFGENSTNAQWALRGTVITSTSLVDPIFRSIGVGCSIKGLVFIHNQPVPSPATNVPYVPITYPWCIKIEQNFNSVEDIYIINATHGIAWDYPPLHGGGTYSYMKNIFDGSLTKGVWFHNVNDTMHVHNYKGRNLWNVSNSNIVKYREDNLTQWHINYLDNIQASGIEFFQSNIGLLFEDSNVNAGAFNITHALALGQFDSVSFNLCTQGMKVANSTTTLTGRFSNVIAQSDSVTGAAADFFFDLSSDNVDVKFYGITAPWLGGGLLKLGGGNSGFAKVIDVSCDQYSRSGANQNFIHLNQGSTLSIPDGLGDVITVPGAGGKISGPGSIKDIRVPARVYAEKGFGNGSVSLVPTADTFSGYVEFDLPNGVRSGFIGHSSSAAKELNVVADDGSINLISTGKAGIEIRNDRDIAFIDGAAQRRMSLNLVRGTLHLPLMTFANDAAAAGSGLVQLDELYKLPDGTVRSRTV